MISGIMVIIVDGGWVPGKSAMDISGPDVYSSGSRVRGTGKLAIVRIAVEVVVLLVF